MRAQRTCVVGRRHKLGGSGLVPDADEETLPNTDKHLLLSGRRRAQSSRGGKKAFLIRLNCSGAD
jgi:hypothetical protein